MLVTMCAFCRRNLLAGERYRHWDQEDIGRSRQAVCSLCERDAARDGWIRSEQIVLREGAIGLRATVRTL